MEATLWLSHCIAPIPQIQACQALGQRTLCDWEVWKVYLLVNRPKIAFQPGGEAPIKLVKLENHAAQGADAASSETADSTTDQTDAGDGCEQIKEGQWRETRAQTIHAAGC